MSDEYEAGDDSEMKSVSLSGMHISLSGFPNMFSDASLDEETPFSYEGAGMRVCV